MRFRSNDCDSIILLRKSWDGKEWEPN